MNLVSLVRAGWCALLVRVVRVLVGSGYLHALNLVSLVGVSLVGVVGVPWFVWFVCPWLVWLPACLEPCVLGSCWFVCLAGSCPGWCGYLHALNLVSLVGVSLVRVLVGVVTYMP